MKAIPWHQSRGIILGILTFLTGAVPLLLEAINKNDYSVPAMLTIVLGLAKIYERVTSAGSPIIN